VGSLSGEFGIEFIIDSDPSLQEIVEINSFESVFLRMLGKRAWG